MKRLELEIDGKTEAVFAQRMGSTLWFHWKGATYCLENEKRSKKSGAAGGGSSSGEILAPMPGKVTKVLVSKGDKVKKNQPVVVMEAMKMEYTLEADQEGVVLELNAQAGAQVGLHQLLVKVGPK